MDTALLGGTLYECVAAATMLGDPHLRLCLHFARIVFFNVDNVTTFPALLACCKTKEPQKSCTVHPAIVAWIRKMCASDPLLPATPLDWYNKCPKLLKGCALRFIYYHRKPHRIYCVRVFAHLIAELFYCNVAIGSEWFYPIISDDYMDVQTIVLCKSSAKPDCYDLLQTKDLMVPLAIIKEITAGSEEYTLRKYESTESKGPVNKHIGTLTKQSDHVHSIFYCPNTPDMYQLFPADERRTFYPFTTGSILSVFRRDENNMLHGPLCQTDAYDHYLYFNLPLDTREVLAVVCDEGEDPKSKIK